MLGRGREFGYIGERLLDGRPTVAAQNWERAGREWPPRRPEAVTPVPAPVAEGAGVVAAEGAGVTVDAAALGAEVAAEQAPEPVDAPVIAG